MSPEPFFGGEGQTIIAPIGESMRPLLRTGRDTVALRKIDARLNPGDVALYKRPSGVLVLHRVIAVSPASYAFLGDAQDMAELEQGVTDSQLIGVMTGFFRGAKYIGIDNPFYRVYRRICLSGDGPRRALRALRSCWLAVKGAPRSAKNK